MPVCMLLNLLTQVFQLEGWCRGVFHDIPLDGFQCIIFRDVVFCTSRDLPHRYDLERSAQSNTASSSWVQVDTLTAWR